MTVSKTGLLITATLISLAGCGSEGTECATEDPVIEASIVTSEGPVTFDGVFLHNIEYSAASGANECVNGFSVDFTVRGDLSCALKVDAAPLADAEGRLVIDQVWLPSNPEGCFGWDLPRTTYLLERSDQPLGTIRISGSPTGDEFIECWDGLVEIELAELTFDDLDGKTLTVEPASLTLSSPLQASSNAFACPDPV